MLTGTIVYDHEEYFDLLGSVRATAKAATGTFTASEMLEALEAVQDTAKHNDSLCARRISATLATLSSHIGQWEIKEVSEGVYEYEGK